MKTHKVMCDDKNLCQFALTALCSAKIVDAIYEIVACLFI